MRACPSMIESQKMTLPICVPLNRSVAWISGTCNDHRASPQPHPRRARAPIRHRAEKGEGARAGSRLVPGADSDVISSSPVLVRAGLPFQRSADDAPRACRAPFSCVLRMLPHAARCCCNGQAMLPHAGRRAGTGSSKAAAGLGWGRGERAWAIMPPKARSLKLRKGMLTISSCSSADKRKMTSDADCDMPQGIFRAGVKQETYKR